jgi:protein-disulfide isomerase
MVAQGFKRAVLVALTLAAVTAPQALRADTFGESMLFSKSTKPPEIDQIPVLTNLVRSGAKLYYIGERSGLFGWFIAKEGQIQMVYVTGDGQTALVGGMFSGRGDNVSGAQIKALAEVNKDIAAMLNESGLQQDEISRVGAVPGGATSVPGDTAAQQVSPGVAGVPAVAVSPGERLMQDLEAASGVTLGKNDKAEVKMVMDVNCHYCRATWREFRDSVKQNKIQIKLVPIANDLKGDNARAAAMLLQVPNTYDAWDRYVNGEKAALDGTPTDIRLRAILANRDLAERWNIRTTPYLVYRGKDGRVKIVQGEPRRIVSILADIER